MIIFVVGIFDFRIFGQIRFYAKNGLYASLFTFLKKLNRAKNIAVIGDGKAFKILFFTKVDKLV